MNRDKLTALVYKSGPTFLRFCVVGGVGFVVDAGVLLLLLKLQISPIILRLCSFSAAVLVTFELNRRWAFKDVNDAYLKQLVGYISVQAGGFLVNLSVFSLLYLLLPTPFNQPLVCIAVASAVALIVNFSGLKLLVFRKSYRAQEDRSENDVFD